MQRDLPQTTPAASERSTASHVIEAMGATGIEWLFCNLGTDHAPLIEDMARRRGSGEYAPRTVLCPHENTAVHMAAGYAYATGRAQAVMVHVDVGTANSAMALHNLQRLRLPVLLMAGRAPYSSHGELLGGRDSYINFVQDPYDQASVVRPYVKWEYQLPSGIIAGQVMARAYERMCTAPQGPVYLTFARETLAAVVDASPADASAKPALPRAGVTDVSTAREIAEKLRVARNPIIITAYAGRDPRSVALLDELTRLAGIRLIEMNPHDMSLPGDSPCHGGYNPTPHVAGVDVGLMIDVDVPWISSMAQAAPGSWWAHLDVDIEKRSFPLWNFPGDIRVGGDTAAMLSQVIAALRETADDAFHARAAARMQVLEADREKRLRAAAAAAADPGQPGALNAAHVCAALARALPADAMVLNEAIRNGGVVFEQIPRSHPGTRLGTAGGGLGYSAGMALGIQLAKPDATVVSIVGDGSFYFGNPQSALNVAARYKLPVLTIVLDNNGWAAVKEATSRVYPHGDARKADAWEAELGGQMDFAMIARAAGLHGETLDHPEQVDSAIASCLASIRGGKAALLHVRIAHY